MSSGFRGTDALPEKDRTQSKRVRRAATYIGRNRIEGSGAFGLQLVPAAPMTASGNEVEGNDFDKFKAAIVDVMLGKGANDNVVLGNSGSLSDLGARNEIRGLVRLTK